MIKKKSINDFLGYRGWFIFSLLSLVVIGIYGLNNPYWGDESHIVETIRSFVDDLSLQKIQDYPEVTPPLFYIIFSIWGKVFGASIESLRIFSLIIAFIEWQLIFLLFSMTTRKRSHNWLLAILTVLNPYFLGTSIFVFTDMITLCFCTAALIFLLKNKIGLFLIFCSFAILCRQYAVIFPLAYLSYWLVSYVIGQRLQIKYLIGSFSAFVPLLLLFIYWHGTAPPSGSQRWMLSDDLTYNLSSITTYLTFSAIYLFPLIIISIIKIKIKPIHLLTALVSVLLFIYYPIAASDVTITQTDLNTVGLIHRGLEYLFNADSIILKLILWLSFTAGIYVTIHLINRLWQNIRLKRIDAHIIYPILWIVFLLIMPLSYQVWEKYLMLILPFLAAGIYGINFDSNKSNNYS